MENLFIAVLCIALGVGVALEAFETRGTLHHATVKTLWRGPREMLPSTIIEAPITEANSRLLNFNDH